MKVGVMVISPLYPELPLRARVAALTTVTGAVAGLLHAGQPPVSAALIALATAVGAVEIGRRLTAPQPAPFVRVTVLVVILMFVINAVGSGYPVPECIGVVLAASWCAAEVARRLTGVPYHWMSRIA
jgi:hypothetical protein